MVNSRRPTIRDVASAAGVSTQTVSRVINNRPDVALETFERVQEVIREIGYAPNMFARGLTQGRSHVLGVVAYGLEYFGPSRTVSAIERQAAEMGYGISLNLILEPETDDVESVLSTLRSRQVDGIIWAIPEVSNNRAWSRTKRDDLPVPVMLVGGTAGDAYLPSISIDNVAIGRLATEHLLAGGADRVGIVTGPLTWCESQQRLAGWRETLADAGRTVEDRLIFEGDWTVSSGEEAFYQMMEACPELDAVFASNDQMALGVLHAAHTVGRKVPNELAVVGVDNIAEASHFWPPLTTVDQPLAEAGARAVVAIDQLIKRSRPTRRNLEPAPEMGLILLRPQLIVRESSRKPAPEMAVAGAAADTYEAERLVAASQPTAHGRLSEFGR